MELLGRGALLLAFLAALYAPIAAIAGARCTTAAVTSARRALTGLLRLRRGRLGRARDRHRAPRLPLRERRRPLLARGAGAVPDLVLLVEPGGVAAALAARAQRPLGTRDLSAPPALARAHAVPRRLPGRRLRVLRVRDELRREPVRHGRPGAARRRRASCRRCRTRTCSRTRRCSTSATSASRSRSRSPWRRSSAGAPTAAGCRPCGAGRSSRGSRSASACSSAPSGPTRRSAGAASGAGIRSRTPR